MKFKISDALFSEQKIPGINPQVTYNYNIEFEISIRIYQPVRPRLDGPMTHAEFPPRPDALVYFPSFNHPQIVVITPTGLDKTVGAIMIDIKGAYGVQTAVLGAGLGPLLGAPRWDGSFEYRYSSAYTLKGGNVGGCAGIDPNSLTFVGPPQLIRSEAGGGSKIATGDGRIVLSPSQTITWNETTLNGTTRDGKSLKIRPYWELPINRPSGGTIKPEIRTWGDLDVILIVKPFIGKAVVPQRLWNELSWGHSGLFREDQRKIDAHDKTVTPPIVEWKKRLELEFPKVFDALRNHKIPLFITGYASMTGGAWYNYVLSADRAAEVQRALKILIGGNPEGVTRHPLSSTSLLGKELWQ